MGCCLGFSKLCMYLKPHDLLEGIISCKFYVSIDGLLERITSFKFLKRQPSWGQNRLDTACNFYVALPFDS